MKKSKLLCALLICGGFITASAEEFKPGFYALANSGTSKMTLGTSRISSNTYEIGAGYEFTKNLAAEVAYGSVSSWGFGTSSSSIDYSLNGFHYSLVGKLPLNDSFIPFASIGRIQGTESLTQTGTTAASSASSGGRYVYAIGVEIPLEARTALRFQSITTTSSSTTATKINMVVGGLIIRF